MNELLIVIILAFIIDSLIGDPQNPFHPIRFIGTGIHWGTILYKKVRLNNRFLSFILGMILSVIIVIGTYILTKMIIDLSVQVNSWFGLGIKIVLCYFVFAAKALKMESMKVYQSLYKNDIEGARTNLSYIVGRDTKNLTSPQIIKATVETIAENLSDGVIAPLIFVFIGGVPLGMAYKAINTLDSMIGYKNETYEFFGKFAARLDDIVNFIPARVSAVLMILSTIFFGGNTKQAIRIFLRDRNNHKSPNSAQTEAVCAGALGLQLGGDSYYQGLLVHKPTIGDSLHEPEIKHIEDANKLMYLATIMLLIIMIFIALVRRFVHV